MRGSVPVVGEVLLVGVVAVIGLVAITLSLGVVSDVDTPAPMISETSGVVASTSDDQTIAVTHVTGDVVRVAEMEAVVDADAACGARARVVGLPAHGRAYLTSDNVRGASVLSTANRSRAAYDLGALTTDRFGSGDRFEVRLTDDCALDPGEEVTVLLVHTSEDAVVSRTVITVPHR